MKRQWLAGLVLGSLVFSLSANANAKPIPLKFAKGSYCTSWRGVANTNKPQFSAFLLANQSISVNTGDSFRVSGGRYRVEGDGFLTKTKGNYLFTFYEVRKGEYVNFEICAY